MAECVQLENEIEIVERAKTNDEAFNLLYDFYFPKIYGYIFKRTGDHHVAEDIVSVTFMKVFTNLKKYQHRKIPFGAWIYRIATNNLIDHYRKASRNKEVAIDYADHLKDERQNPQEFAQLGQDKQMVIQIIHQLNDRYKAVLNLRYFADLSHEEIAKTLGISNGNARILIHRALKQFEKIYSESRNK